MPTTKVLWIDGVGSYAMCDGSSISIGQAAPGNVVDLAIRGELSRRACFVHRTGGDHVVEPIQSMKIDGRSIDRPAILTDGCVLTLGERVQLRYQRPTLLSSTARLELVSQHRWQPILNAALLLGESCVVGPEEQAHVVCLPPRGISWGGKFLFFRRGNEWMCRAIDCQNLVVDGIPTSAPFLLKPGLRVQSDVACWSLQNQ